MSYPATFTKGQTPGVPYCCQGSSELHQRLQSSQETFAWGLNGLKGICHLNGKCQGWGGRTCQLQMKDGKGAGNGTWEPSYHRPWQSSFVQTKVSSSKNPTEIRFCSLWRTTTPWFHHSLLKCKNLAWRTRKGKETTPLQRKHKWTEMTFW
jgi:hypothetical protein